MLSDLLYGPGFMRSALQLLNCNMCNGQLCPVNTPCTASLCVGAAAVYDDDDGLVCAANNVPNNKCRGMCELHHPSWVEMVGKYLCVDSTGRSCVCETMLYSWYVTGMTHQQYIQPPPDQLSSEASRAVQGLKKMRVLAIPVAALPLAAGAVCRWRIALQGALRGHTLYIHTHLDKHVRCEGLVSSIL